MLGPRPSVVSQIGPRCVGQRRYGREQICRGDCHSYNVLPGSTGFIIKSSTGSSSSCLRRLNLARSIPPLDKVSPKLLHNCSIAPTLLFRQAKRALDVLRGIPHCIDERVNLAGLLFCC